MANDPLATQDREWLQMIAQRSVGPVPIDDALMVKFVRLGLVDGEGEHPTLTDLGRAALQTSH